MSVAAALVLLLSLAMMWARRGAAAIWLCAAQGVCAGAALALAGSPVALLAVALNGIAMPLALGRVDVVPVRQRIVSWAVALALLLVAIAVLAKVGAGDVMALGTAVLLLGLLSARGAPALGLLSAQNGLIVVASAMPWLPPQDLLVVALPVVPAMLLANAWSRP